MLLRIFTFAYGDAHGLWLQCMQLKKENAAKETGQVKYEEELRAKMKELQVWAHCCSTFNQH